MNYHEKMLLCLLVFACSFVAAAAIDADATKDREETLLDLGVVDKLFGIYLAQEPGLKGSDEWTTLEDFTKTWPKSFVQRLPERDGWDREFLVRSFDAEWLVVSRGQDGSIDLDDETKLAKFLSRGRRGRSASQIGDDLILVVGDGVSGGPRTNLQNQREAMADLRSLGTAVETFSIDNNYYPVQDQGLQRIEIVQRELEPVYIRTAPLRDGWGNEYLYWSDGERYIIISTGQDGRSDRPYVEGVESNRDGFGGAFETPETDLVFENGQFIQWPKGTQQ